METFDLKPEDITNLDLKLKGILPVNRDELLALANTWGRNDWFYTSNKYDNTIEIKTCKSNEKYDLSKLDVSQIINFCSIFEQSNFDGDISSWNVAKAISMDAMFYYAEEFNQSLNSWNISNVTSMYGTFYKAEKFNQPIFWDLSHIESCYNMFYESKAFETRFNNGIELPIGTKKIKNWLIENRDKMIALDIENSKGKELDNFLLNLNVIDSANLNGLHNNGIYNGKI